MSALKVVIESCLRFGFKDALITPPPYIGSERNGLFFSVSLFSPLSRFLWLKIYM